MTSILLGFRRAPIIISLHLEPARHLHQELWETDLHSTFDKVPGRRETYVSRSRVTSLQLHGLGFDEEALLVRNEYVTALKTLGDMSTTREGVVITGQRGAGTLCSLFVLGPYKYYYLRKVLFPFVRPHAPLVQRKAHSITNIRHNYCF